MDDDEARFTIKPKCEYQGEGFFSNTMETRIIVDEKTGVNYLWVASGYGGGLTVMVDADGKPIVTK